MSRKYHKRLLVMAELSEIERLLGLPEGAHLTEFTIDSGTRVATLLLTGEGLDDACCVEDGYSPTSWNLEKGKNLSSIPDIVRPRLVPDPPKGPYVTKLVASAWDLPSEYPKAVAMVLVGVSEAERSHELDRIRQQDVEVYKRVVAELEAMTDAARELD